MVAQFHIARSCRLDKHISKKIPNVKHESTLKRAKIHKVCQGSKTGFRLSRRKEPRRFADRGRISILPDRLRPGLSGMGRSVRTRNPRKGNHHKPLWKKNDFRKISSLVVSLPRSFRITIRYRRFSHFCAPLSRHRHLASGRTRCQAKLCYSEHSRISRETRVPAGWLTPSGRRPAEFCFGRCATTL